MGFKKFVYKKSARQWAIFYLTTKLKRADDAADVAVAVLP